jgi:hypothetical protein
MLLGTCDSCEFLAGRFAAQAGDRVSALAPERA